MTCLPGFSTDLASLGWGGSGKIVSTSSRFFLAVWQGGNCFWRTPELGGAAVIESHSLFSRCILDTREPVLATSRRVRRTVVPVWLALVHKASSPGKWAAHPSKSRNFGLLNPIVCLEWENNIGTGISCKNDQANHPVSASLGSNLDSS